MARILVVCSFIEPNLRLLYGHISLKNTFDFQQLKKICFSPFEHSFWVLFCGFGVWLEATTFFIKLIWFSSFSWCIYRCSSPCTAHEKCCSLNIFFLTETISEPDTRQVQSVIRSVASDDARPFVHMTKAKAMLMTIYILRKR